MYSIYVHLHVYISSRYKVQSTNPPSMKSSRHMSEVGELPGASPSTRLVVDVVQTNYLA